MLHNVQPKAVRERLDNAFRMLQDVDVTKQAKLRELWAIMSDIELWMEDMELRMRASEDRESVKR